MVCIYCSTKLEVSNSRQQHRSNQVWRRRICPNCGAQFTTHEKIDLTNSLVVKDAHDKLSPFSRDRLLLSIYKSCGHRKNSLIDAAGITDTVIARLSKLNTNGMIVTREIIQICTSVLQNFDKAAVVQYKAYHPDSAE